jgi:hypothetical protein
VPRGFIHVLRACIDALTIALRAGSKAVEAVSQCF